MPSAPVLLELDLAHGLRESPPADLLAAIRERRTPVLPDLVERLRRAAGHPEVGGLIAHVGAEVLTAAQVEELGAAVEAFSRAGKRTYCWAEAYGEAGAGTLGYHFAAHFDEIWLQPTGDLGLVGRAASGTFLRGALDRLGVVPQVHARHEYKNAPDALLRDSMSDAQRETLQRLTDSQVEQISSTIVRRRGLTDQAVRAAIAAAPLSAQQALDARLIDKVGYRDQVYAAAKAHARKTAGSDVELRFVQSWSPPKLAEARRLARQEVRRRARRGAPRPVIAVVEVEGAIVLGPAGGRPGGSPQAGSDAVGAALRQAGRDEAVAGVVLRIDSPGGSYVASDVIHREVDLLRQGGKPVFASMGSVAASGGYFAAMGADRIFALPSTITGSIGVFAGKVVVGRALQQIGINSELVSTGEQSTMWTPTEPFTKAQIERLDAWLDVVYDDFTQKAAAGRGMEHGELEPLARGRVWSGADAAARGLVDELGSMESAVAALSDKIGVRRDDVAVRRYPHLTQVSRLKTPTSSEAPSAALRSSLTALSADAVAAQIAGTLAARGPELLLEQLSARFGLGAAGALNTPLPLPR